MIQQVMEGMRIPFLTAKGFEADDVMATVASEGAARGFDVFICSSDKDLRQCITARLEAQDMLVNDWL